MNNNLWNWPWNTFPASYLWQSWQDMLVAADTLSMFVCGNQASFCGQLLVDTLLWQRNCIPHHFETTVNCDILSQFISNLCKCLMSINYLIPLSTIINWCEDGNRLSNNISNISKAPWYNERHFPAKQQ